MYPIHFLMPFVLSHPPSCSQFPCSLLYPFSLYPSLSMPHFLRSTGKFTKRKRRNNALFLRDRPMKVTEIHSQRPYILSVSVFSKHFSSMTAYYCGRYLLVIFNEPILIHSALRFFCDFWYSSIYRI